MIAPSANPDWYRIRYSLVTERVNWALVDEGARQSQLGIARAEAQDLLSAIAGRLGRRRSWGRQARREKEGRALDAFLRVHLKPSLLVLFAAIELGRSVPAVTRGKPSAEASALRGLERQIQGPSSLDPFLIVQTVEASCEQPSQGLSYNLACFYSQAEDSARALMRLRETVELTPPSAWPRLRSEVESDPVLRPLRKEVDSLFEDPLQHGGQSTVRSGSRRFVF